METKKSANLADSWETTYSTVLDCHPDSSIANQENVSRAKTTYNEVAFADSPSNSTRWSAISSIADQERLCIWQINIPSVKMK